MMDFSRFKVVTFDCYGTLIDWEGGILGAVEPLLSSHGIHLPEGDILERYARYESEAEEGDFRPYREVLRSVMDSFGGALGIQLTPEERDRLATSLPDWPPFPDTVPSLQALRRRFRLAVVSNVDDDLFAGTARHLEVDFAYLVTAQQVGSYKPSPNNFHEAVSRIGEPVEAILHVAQSLHHDVAPARELGLTTVWVNRRMGKGGGGATPPSDATPDLTVPDLATLVSLVEGR
jgi:2-haloacid dehalogenase